MSKKSRYGRIGFPRNVGRHAVPAPVASVEQAAPGPVTEDEAPLISSEPLDEDFDDDADAADGGGEVFSEAIEEDPEEEASTVKRPFPVSTAAPATMTYAQFLETGMVLDEDDDDADAGDLDDDDVFSEAIEEDPDERFTVTQAPDVVEQTDEIDGPAPEDVANADDEVVAVPIEEDPDDKPVMTKPLAPPPRPEPMFMHPKAPPSAASRFSPPPLRPPSGAASATPRSRPGFLPRNRDNGDAT